MKKFILGIGTWLWNILIWLDQGINVIIFLGSPDETLSARCHRQGDTSKFWGVFRDILNKIVFKHQKNHCKSAYISEDEKLQLPSEYQD